MPSGVTLPSIRDSSYFQSEGQRNTGAYGGSPNSGNGYPLPPNGGRQQPYLPPLQPPTNPRSPTYPAEPRDDAYRQPPPPPPGAYPPGPYYGHYAQPPPPHPGAYPPHAYGPPPPGAYNGTVMPQVPQAAPRQRTSIACKYCRKRKIRCSGYQSAPGGKCLNCSRMGMECIFQPVSSASSTAFVPVSALPGGVPPPGTPLFGAYGQPMTHQGPPPHPQAPLPHPQAYPPQGYGNYPPPLPSPTYGSPYDGRDPAMGHGAGRRRPRGLEDEDEHREQRLPPPHPNAIIDDPRRRSPATSSNNGSPPQQYPSAPNTTHSPGSTGPVPSPLSRGSTQSYGQSYEGSTPPPARAGAAPPAAGANNGGNPMSLSSVMDGSGSSDIDRSMLGKLNSRARK